MRRYFPAEAPPGSAPRKETRRRELEPNYIDGRASPCPTAELGRENGGDSHTMALRHKGGRGGECFRADSKVCKIPVVYPRTPPPEVSPRASKRHFVAFVLFVVKSFLEIGTVLKAGRALPYK